MYIYIYIYVIAAVSGELSRRATAIAHWSDVGRYPTLGFPNITVQCLLNMTPNGWTQAPHTNCGPWHSSLLWSCRGGRRAVCHWILETRIWQRLSNQITCWKRSDFFTELWMVDEGSKYATCAPGNSDGDCAGSSSSRQPREAPGPWESGQDHFRP